MPFDGSGNFIPLTLPDFPAIGGQPIYATQFNNVISDLMNGLGSVVTRDGQTPMTGALQMAGNKITGLAAATTAGDAVMWGQAATLGALTLTGALAAVGATLSDNVAISKASGNVVSFTAGIASGSSVLFGYNTTGSASSLNTPAGHAFLGSPNSIQLDVALGGVVQMNFQPGGPPTIYGADAVLNLRTTALRGAGRNYINFYDATGIKGNVGYSSANDTLYLSNPIGSTVLLSGSGGAILTNGDFTVTTSVTAPTFYGHLNGIADSVPWGGVTSRPTTLAGYGITDGGALVSSVFGRTGAVTLTSGDVTTALGYTPLSAISSGMIATALGYTPYNAANPSGYLSSITSSQINAALGYTAYNGVANSANFVTTVANVDDFVGSDASVGYDLTNATLTKSGTTITLTRRKVYRAAADPGSGGGA